MISTALVHVSVRDSRDRTHVYFVDNNVSISSPEKINELFFRLGGVNN